MKKKTEITLRENEGFEINYHKDYHPFMIKIYNLGDKPVKCKSVNDGDILIELPKYPEDPRTRIKLVDSERMRDEDE